MNLVERISQGLSSLRPYDGFREDLKIGDLKKPFHEVFPSGSQEPPSRIMVRNRDEDEGEIFMEKNSRDNPLASLGMKCPVFAPVMKRTSGELVFEQEGAIGLPVHIGHGLWLGLKSLVKRYEQDLLQSDPEIMDRPLDNKNIEKVIRIFQMDCLAHDIWWMGPEEYRCISSVEIRSQYIPLLFPYLHPEDENGWAYVMENFAEGPRGVCMLLEFYLEDDYHNISPEEKEYLIQNDIEECLRIYADSTIEKSVDLGKIFDQICNYEDIYKDHPIIAEFDPPLVSFSYEGVILSLQEERDIEGYFAYCKRFNDNYELIPEWLWNGDSSRIREWMEEIIRICKEEKKKAIKIAA